MPPPIAKRVTKSQSDGKRAAVNQVALFQIDGDYRRELIQSAVDLPLPFVLYMRQQLRPLASAELTFFRNKIDSNNQSSVTQLKAAIMIAGESANPSNLKDWKSTQQQLTASLIEYGQQAPHETECLIDGLRPLAPVLLPEIRVIALQDRGVPDRSYATALMVQFLKAKPEDLFDFFLDAGADQHTSIVKFLDAAQSQLLMQAKQEAFSEISTNLDEVTYDRFARRKGTAASLLHRWGQPDATWPLFAASERPHVRSYLIHRSAKLGNQFSATLNRFSREPQASNRTALLNALAEHDWNRIPKPIQLQALSTVKNAFKDDPDAGVHSAAQWALKQWGESQWLSDEIQSQSRLSPDPRKNWFVNSEGITMAIIDAREQPDIGRVFAISTHEITVQQFLRYRPDHEYYTQRSPSDDCPVGMLNWHLAVDYCRWLSSETGLSGGYPTELSQANPDHPYDDVVNEGAYRLPTASEWLHACAAGTSSKRYYGYGNELADHYFWHFETAAISSVEARYFPAATKPANDFGMFSMYDNVQEWSNTKLGDRRLVMGSRNASHRSTRSTIPKRQVKDFARIVNGFYGMRVAQTVTGN